MNKTTAANNKRSNATIQKRNLTHLRVRLKTVLKEIRQVTGLDVNVSFDIYDVPESFPDGLLKAAELSGFERNEWINTEIGGYWRLKVSDNGSIFIHDTKMPHEQSKAKKAS